MQRNRRGSLATMGRDWPNVAGPTSQTCRIVEKGSGAGNSSKSGKPDSSAAARSSLLGIRRSEGDQGCAISQTLLTTRCKRRRANPAFVKNKSASSLRSEEHTSELQSHHDLVCCRLLEKKNIKTQNHFSTTHATKAYNHI